MYKPQVFGKYLLIDKISHGGMGEVYKAKSFGSQGFEKLFAVKRILPKLSKTSAFIEMLADEAKIIVHLAHSNIAQVYEFSEVDKIFYLAMEFIHGKDLRSIMERTENVPIEIAAYLIAELCKGLHYLHNVTNDTGQKLGIVHRDISPRNIIVSFEGEVKIIDFGIANARTRAFTIGNDIFVGKYSYMSPEQLLGKELTHKSDIFSSGIVLYELIFGKLPPGKIRDRNLIELDKENIEVDPKLEKKLLAKLPQELRIIIEKATAIRPEDRYDNALTFYNDLTNFIGHYQRRVDSFMLSHYLKNLFSSEIYGSAAPTKESKADQTLVLKDQLTAFSERKKVALLNINVSHTSESPAKDSEEKLVLDAFKEIIRIIQKNGGSMYRLQDTDLIAIFGIPRSQEDDVERALFSALQVDRYLASHAADSKARIALDYGTVIVTFKDQDLRNYSISEGPEIRVKSLLGVARDREILFGRGIEAIAKEQFAIEEINRPGTSCFRLIDIKETLRAYIRKIEGEKKFVNREKEFVFIEKLFGEVNFDTGHVIFIKGEPGIGKTALIEEVAMRGMKANTPVFIQSFHPYIKTPYSIFKQTILQLLSLETFDKELLAAKIAELAGFGLTKTELDALRNIFSISYKNQNLDALTQEKRKLIVLFALRKIMEGIAREKSIFIIEDLQHADELSLEVLDSILIEGPLSNMLIILTERLEFSYTWQYKNLDAFTLKLLPFAQASLNTYIQTITGGVPLGKNSLTKVYGKTGGNPLFTHELIQSLLEAKKMTIANSEYNLLPGAETYLIPDTIYGLLAARIDALKKEEKSILQLIAIIGKEFSFDELEHLVGAGLVPAQRGQPQGLPLQEKLMVLLSLGIIREKEGAPMRRYEITHSLMQEVAYKNLSLEFKQSIHTQIANYLEVKHASVLDEHIINLAYHYGRSNDFAKAFTYLVKAGDETNQLYLLSEAHRYYVDAIVCFSCDLKPPVDEYQKLVELNYKVGVVDQILGKLDISTEALNEGLKISQERNIQEFAPKLYYQLARTYRIKGDYDKALEYIDQSVATTRETANHRNELKLMHEQATLYRLSRKKDDVRRMLEKGLEESRKIQDKYLESMYLNSLGIVYENQHEYRKALLAYKRTLELRKEQKDRLALSIVFTNISSIFFKINKRNKALEYAKKALRISSEIEDKLGICMNLNNLGEMYLAQNDLAKALNHFERSLVEAAEASWKEGIILGKIHWSLIHALTNGDRAKARILIEEALSMLHEFHNPEYLAKAYMVKAKLLELAHDAESSLACLTGAQEIIKQYNLDKSLQDFEKMLQK